MTIYALPQSRGARIVQHAVVTGAAVGAMYAVEAIAHADWGQYSPLVAAAAVIIGNMLRVYAQEPPTA